MTEVNEVALMALTLAAARIERDVRLHDLTRDEMSGLISAIEAALSRPAGDGWRDISSAPKDRTRILVQLRDPLPAEGRPDLERWYGIPFVASHPGVEKDGFDIGWSFAAPVGQGGFPDSWIAGWMPLPAAPSSNNGENK
jgi:hypothetical protein